MFYILLEPLAGLGICYTTCYFKVNSTELYKALKNASRLQKSLIKWHQHHLSMTDEWGNEQNSVAGYQQQYHS